MPGCGPACTKVLRWETFGCLREEAPWAHGLLVGSWWPSQEHHLLLPPSGNRRDSPAFTKAVKEVPFPPSTCSLPFGGRAQNSAPLSNSQELPPPLMVRGGKRGDSPFSRLRGRRPLGRTPSWTRERPARGGVS